jgi:peroxiredoxin family protein
MDEKPKTLALVVFSGTTDRLFPVGILASGAVAMGMKVEIFLTFWGLQAFAKRSQGMPPKFSVDYAEMAPMFGQVLKQKNVPSPIETLRMAKKLGDVRIYACTMTMDLLGQTKEDFIDLVDETAGVGEFMDRAKDASMSLFI